MTGPIILSGIKDIDNIIYNYKYQLEHIDKLNKSLDLIKKIDYRLTENNKFSSSFIHNNYFICYLETPTIGITIAKAFILKNNKIDIKNRFNSVIFYKNNKYYDELTYYIKREGSRLISILKK